MSKHVLTRYAVDRLVESRKIAGRHRASIPVNPRLKDLPLFIEVRLVNSPKIEIALVFEARAPRKSLPGVANVRRPSASLMWTGDRIRGIDWTIKHEVTRRGIPTGEIIRGWHEHYWTDEDGSAAIRHPKPPPKNQDVSALIAWACGQWNIEGVEESMRLFP
jgi:hypothetical protein